MAWSKVKKNLESFLTPKLIGIVEYTNTSYRYTPESAAKCCIVVDKVEVFRKAITNSNISWYTNEQDIKNDPYIMMNLTDEDIEKVRRNGKGRIPEDRLAIIARNNKFTQLSKEIMEAQALLLKSDFHKSVNTFLTQPIDDSLNSNDILLNIFAILDRRVGKKRILNMKNIITQKHSAVRYFWELRRRHA